MSFIKFAVTTALLVFSAGAIAAEASWSFNCERVFEGNAGKPIPYKAQVMVSSSQLKGDVWTPGGDSVGFTANFSTNGTAYENQKRKAGEMVVVYGGLTERGHMMFWFLDEAMLQGKPGKMQSNDWGNNQMTFDCK